MGSQKRRNGGPLGRSLSGAGETRDQGSKASFLFNQHGGRSTHKKENQENAARTFQARAQMEPTYTLYGRMWGLMMQREGALAQITIINYLEVPEDELRNFRGPGVLDTSIREQDPHVRSNDPYSG